MPARPILIEQVASQMMKSGRPGRPLATEQQKREFQKRHESYIVWVLDNLPRTSAAFPAVIVKCFLKYDKNVVLEFCKAIRTATFKGQNDPAFLLWKFLQKYRGHDSILVYRRSVCAAKAYMEGRTLTALRLVKDDIFDWNDDWTVPDKYLKNRISENTSQEATSAFS
jgi:hypothetical protein